MSDIPERIWVVDIGRWAEYQCSANDTEYVLVDLCEKLAEALRDTTRALRDITRCAGAVNTEGAVGIAHAALKRISE